MCAIGPSSLDMLTTEGIIPYDATQFVKGTPSPYLESIRGRQPYAPSVTQYPLSPTSDTYGPKKKKSSWLDAFHKVTQKYKEIAFGTLVLYVAGVIASKGSKNPIDGAKGLGRGLNKVLDGLCWLVKKMWA